jgi:alpha-L-fucosidase
MANLFSDIGWDVRWAGTEGGSVPETSWATFTPKPAEGANVAVPGQSLYSQNPLGTRNGKYWMPAECDVPLRRGWFYHADEKPKSPEKLFDLYLRSVGHGAALDVGLAPDSIGQLCPDDVAALKGFGDILRHTFENNLAKDARIVASNTRGEAYNVKNLSDGNKSTYWATTDDAHEATLTLHLKKPETFDIISLQEYIPLGQRIEGFNVEVFENGAWKKVYEGASIGAKRLIKLNEPVTSNEVRINITQSPVCITLSEVGLYKERN